MDKIEKHAEQLASLAVKHAPMVLLAIVVLLVGIRVINGLTKLAGKAMDRQGIDATLRPFLKSLLGWTLKAMLFISAASMVGIETTSFVAVLGAAGLAVGFALQGTLANFAGGVLILIFRPYKVGDLIQAQGHLGHVREVQIFVTILETLDSKTVIIPNGAISNGDITNLTTLGKIRVDLVMGISYGDNIKVAKDALLAVMKNHPKVLQDPAPFVGVLELGDNSVNLAVRPYADPANYWPVYFDIYEQGKIALDEAGITIPFPQVDLHVKDIAGK